MKLFRTFILAVFAYAFIFSPTLLRAQGQDYSGNEDPNKKIIKSGLLGAATGAVAAGASGGKAGKGALIGAGTNVIGGALLDTLTSGPSQPRPQQVQYVQAAPQYVQQTPQYVQQAPVQSSYPVQTIQTQPQYVEPQPMYVQQQAPVYYQQPPQEDPNKKIIKSGLLGAGVGAISASASGGSAGKGALIGAGTNVIGGALLDTLMGSGQQAQPQPVYYQQAPPQQYYQQSPNVTSGSYRAPQKKIIRKYDADGNVVSEEEVWQ